MEEPIVFRNDDVSANTDFKSMLEIYDILKTLHPGCRIISSITLASKRTNRGSVYDEVPFKENPVPWFYDFNQFLDKKVIDDIPYEKASHGLFHVDHTKLKQEAQLMSIYSSCQYIGTNVFVPPFNRWDWNTRQVCKQRGVHLMLDFEWKSIEHEPFDPKHKHWYFHSWRFNKQSIRRVLDGNSLHMAKL